MPADGQIRRLFTPIVPVSVLCHGVLDLSVNIMYLCDYLMYMTPVR